MGFSLGQFLWGPIGDRHGRRLPVAVGLVLFAVGSAGCVLAESVWAMVGWRVVQAVGACAGVVLARAMVRDLCEGDRAARMLSTLMTAMAVAPLLGPVLGGQILAFAGRRAIFWALVGVGLLTLAALFNLAGDPAGRPAQQRAAGPGAGPLRRDPPPPPAARLRGRGRLLLRRGLRLRRRHALRLHRLPPRAAGALRPAVRRGRLRRLAANLANARLVGRLGSGRLLVRGAGAAALAGAAAGVAARTGWGGLWGLAAPLFLFVSAAGFIVANSLAGTLAGSPERAGAVSALVGAVHYGGGIAGSALVGACADGTAWPMGWVVALAGAGSLLCTRLLVPARTREAATS